MNTKKKTEKAFQWDSFDDRETRKVRVARPVLPNKQNPVVVRIVTRSELEAIPKNRYNVRVIKVIMPYLETGEAQGEEELMVAITDSEHLTKQLKKIRYKYRTLMRNRNGGGGGNGEPPSNPFHEPIDQGKMADCIIQVMDDIFHGADKCTICEKDYSRMEFCVLMHIFFKKANFLKKTTRLQFSTFIQNKVLAGKSGFVRTYNTYADKDIYKFFEEELEIEEIDFKSHPMPIPHEKKFSDYHLRTTQELSLAFQEIGWHFQKSPYFKELKENRKTMNNLVL